MKIKKTMAYPVLFTFLLVGMLFGYQNCAKKRELNIQMSQNAQRIVETNQRVVDLESILSGLIEEERQARIAADNELNKRVDDLTNVLTTYQTQTNYVLNNIQKQTDDLQVSFTNVNSNFNLQVTQLEGKINTQIVNLDQSLRSALTANTDGLQSQIIKNRDNILLLQNQSEDQKKTIIDQGQQILDLAKSHEEFKTLVATTYATKVDLDNIKGMYDSLIEVTKNLDMKINRTKEEVLKTLGEDINLLSSRMSVLEVKVTNQGKSIETIQSDLASAITEYRNGLETMSKDFRTELMNTESKVGVMIQNNNKELKNEIFLNIQKESLMLTLYMKKAVSEITNSIVALEKRVNELKDKDQAAKDDLLQKINALKQNMADALASEQEERNKIAADVEILTQRLQRVETDLKEVKSMTELNAKMLAKISLEFEQEKQSTASRFMVMKSDIDQKFELLKNDFTKKLQDVADKSESLVRNLGLDIQVQFKKVTSDVAILNSRQSNLEHNLKNFIEQYQTDKAKTVQFESSMIGPRKEVQTHLSNVIEALSSLQLRFVQVLNPIEEHKDFYDEDFKPIARVCKGIDQASFSNALGLDSFQILSIEYTRLLLTGLRSGDKDRDRIFFDYGDIEEEGNFARSIALGLIRISDGAENKECLTKIQNWARNILLEEKRFKDIADRLSNDEEFERRLEVLYTTFEQVKTPAAKIQSILEKIVIGLSNKDNVYQILISQTVLDIINGAWDQRLLSDRLAILDNFEKFQTEQNELSAEMRVGFKDLRNLLAQFQQTTATRLSNLEKEQGAIKISLKRALDVIMSLADRAGYDDLKAYTIWAGRPIEYTPVIFPNWKPVTQTVQHFFSGPKSLMNNSDACTGNKILPNAGIQSYYQFGKWGPCWVNFRTIPLDNWGNEAKTLWLRVFGAGNTVNISVDPNKQKERPELFKNYNYNKSFSFVNLSDADPALKMDGVFSKAVFDIKVPDLLDFYIKNIRTWGGITLTISTSRIDQVVNTQSNVIDYNIQMFSPIVLDFHQSSMPRSIASSDSGIWFDHKGEGIESRTGWINGNEAAFLVHLKDKKLSKISGRDLFGEGTSIGYRKAQNGFEALAYFDSNRDHIISSADKIWNELYLFFDFNQNGEIDNGELVTLSEMGVAKLSLNYHEIDSHKGFQFGNDFRYVAKAFDGDNNPKATIYDVFFGVE